MASTSSTPRKAPQVQAPDTAVDTPMGYQAQHSSMTLREGLAEYFRQNRGLMDEADLPGDLSLGLHSHDIAHVVFGCDTSLLGEVVLVRWSLFGVTGSLRPYLLGLRRRETRGLFRDAIAGFRPRMLWRLVKLATIAIARSLRMRERWPFEAYAPYLDQPLCEIRERFGIRVIAAG